MYEVCDIKDFARRNNMRNKYWMRLLTIHLCLIVLGSSIVKGQVSSETAKANKDRIQARQLWDQLVKVRGGREKLHAMTNMLLIKGNKPEQQQQIEFYVYPNRYWEWSKGKIVHEYNDVLMANLDRGVYLFDPQPINAQKLQTVKGGANYRETWLIEVCSFVLETKWLQPIPVRVSRQVVGKEKLDVIETYFPDLEEYRNTRLDFYIDPESLVVRGVEQFDDKGNSWSYYSFDGHTEISGIVVPSQFRIFRRVADVKKGAYTPLTFQFNVDYDKELFDRPPSVKAGPDAWKPRTKY